MTHAARLTQKRLEGEILKPCQRCGKCCKAETCMIGETVFGSAESPCPALIKHNNIHVCGFIAVEKEAGLKPILRKALGIGRGCDSEFADNHPRRPGDLSVAV